MKKLTYSLKHGDITLAEGTVELASNEDRYLMVKIYKDLAAKNINRRFWFRKVDNNSYKSRTGYSLTVKELNNDQND